MANGAQAVAAIVGSERLQRLAEQANRFAPELRTNDRYGHRIDAVEYHPAYHELMAIAFGAGCHALAWTEERAGRFVARAALNYLWNQGEQGVACPVTMTFAAVQVLRRAPALAATWEPRITAFDYDPRPLPVQAKRAATVGMAMTEKQGGSDLRAVATRAEATEEGYLLTGHKWFCSAPMSDGFLTLARTTEGMTCFFVPRSLEDGRRNRFFIQRLKEKVGNRSNASSEIEYDRTWAHCIGQPGRGIGTLIEMAHLTRFDIVVACAGMMRSMLRQALHHADHRRAFGKRLVDHALMQNVLADLVLETESAVRLAFRLARAFDSASVDRDESLLARILTPIAKYWLCKRMPAVALEAMETIGGSGYVEEHPLARLYREAPLNGIWEGSGNVICLDVLRTLKREPEAVRALMNEIRSSRDARIEEHAATTERLAGDEAALEAHARRIVERLAVALQASLIARDATADVIEAFVSSRIREGLRTFGALDGGTAFAKIIAHA